MASCAKWAEGNALLVTLAIAAARPALATQPATQTAAQVADPDAAPHDTALPPALRKPTR